MYDSACQKPAIADTVVTHLPRTGRPALRFECYSHWSQLPGHADSLFAQASRTSLFCTAQWFETLTATALDEGVGLVLACVVDQDEVLALLALVSDGDDRWRALRHRYTSFYGLLLAEHDQAEILGCLAEGVARSSVRSILLEPVDPDDAHMLALRAAMASVGFTCSDHFRFYNWFHRTRGQTFEEYLAERPTRIRNTIARKRRKLEREHGFEIRLFTGGAVQEALDDYHAAYTASWKANEQYIDLLDGLAINLSVPDWTRLAVLYAAGEVVAAQLWFVVDGRASIFRLAHDERWKAWSPGTILTAWLMEYVIDTDHVTDIDFLTGNEKYKQDWMSERRERCIMAFIRQHGSQRGSGSLLSMLGGLLRGRSD